MADVRRLVQYTGPAQGWQSRFCPATPIPHPPGRRETERKRFASLIKAVERIRIRDGMTNAELARGSGTGANVVSGWLNGRAIGRGESVQRLKAFLNSYTASKQR